ncbi:GtrA family protein [Vibrio breoganii]|uniref:GtrA family protein n=1 Tax=Vibrio breoganii TaxID=553239 RepID=UPI000C8539B1|nr:GtrA family protein [Vibrio breoganii]PMG06166.1 hypothetical protein BCV00_11160 [Vibrio breoganii]
MSKTLLYVAFAILATFVNLIAQEAASQVFQSKYELLISIFFGTLAGLMVKYMLDKTYIFNYSANTHRKNATTFFLYSLMGIVTTFIFWGTEYAFDTWFETKTMRYLGAVIGLSIGYAIKYYLDRKYVFVER